MARTDSAAARNALCEALDQFAKTCPTAINVKARIANGEREYSFTDPIGNSLEVCVWKTNAEVFFGNASFEYFELTVAETTEIMQICDAVRAGRVWDMSSKSRGVQRTVFRVPETSPKDWIRDGRATCGYCFSPKTYDWIKIRYPFWPA